MIDLEAIQSYRGGWLIRPAGALGTIGWHPCAWEAYRVPRSQARSAADAIRRARRDGPAWCRHAG